MSGMLELVRVPNRYPRVGTDLVPLAMRVIFQR